MINSRDINDLHPVVREKAIKMKETLRKKKCPIIFTSTLRDAEYQASLYAQGRTKPGNIVTNMKDIGPHGFGLAFDVVPVVDGECVWNDAAKWKLVGEVGKKLGFEWGGDWKSFPDKPHFEMADGLTGLELRLGKRPRFWKRILKRKVVKRKPKTIVPAE